MSLPAQAWTGERRPSPERFEDPLPRLPNGGWAKPVGGFWTSTYDDRRLSDWCQWCLSAEWNVSRDIPVFPIWELEPEPEAKVLRIDSLADLATVVEQYPSKPLDPELGPELPDWQFPDWPAVAEDYDAVHLTADGQWETRLTQPYNLYSWDCESTLWFRWAFTRVTFRGLVWVPYDNIWEED